MIAVGCDPGTSAGAVVRIDTTRRAVTLAAEWQRMTRKAGDVLPPEGFDAKLAARLAQIVRDLYAEQQAAMDEVDALTRKGRGTSHD